MSVGKSAKLVGALFAVLVALGSATGSAGAQGTGGTVAGIVVDSATGRGLIGAHITVDGSSRAALTAEDGRYVITNVPAGTHVVRAARLGFAAGQATVTVVDGESATANFAIGHTTIVLADVVSVGYGEKSRRDLTESIATVKAEDVNKTAVTTVEQGLQGRVAGVQVTTGDAAPGGGMRVQIRGVNSMNTGSSDPLYVIDGVPVSSSNVNKGTFNTGVANSLTETNPLATLSPSDIESIDILKDASATAIYGSRGANGVVLITTKKGRANIPGQLTLNVSQGFSSVTKKLDVLTAPEFARYVNLSFKQGYNSADSDLPYGGRPGSWSPDKIQQTIGNGTDWQDLIFRTAPVTDAQLSVSGGDLNGSYLVSGNVLSQQGVILGSSFRRGGIRANLDRVVNERFRMQTNLALTRSINDMVRSSTTSGYRDIGIVRQAVTYVPMKNLNADTTTTNNDPRAVNTETWLRYGADPLRYTDEVSENDGITRGLGNFKIITQLPLGVALDLSIGGNYERRGYGEYLPRTVNEGYTANGIAIAAGSEYYNLVSDNLLRYAHDLGSIQHFDVMGGFSYENSRSTWLSNNVSGFANDYLGGTVLQQGAKVATPYSGLANWKLASFLGRVNYSLLDRYLLTGTVRSDGSSKFAENKKWATFTSAAFAWRVLDEPFLKSRGTFGLNDLKFRISAGQSGNQAINPYQSLASIEGGTTPVNDVQLPIYYISRLANPNLKWETTTQYDAGFDLTAWDNRLTATVDVYRKSTADLLQNITVSSNTGFSNATINSGNVTNKGIELASSITPVASSNGGFQWTLGANAARNINRLESLGQTAEQFSGEIASAGGGPPIIPFIQRPGLALGSIWGYVVEGIQDHAPTAADLARDPSTHYGDWRYKDINGDGKIDSHDQTLIGSAYPKWTYGVSNSVSWKNFDASALVTGVVGGNIINSERWRYLAMNAYINIPKYYIDRAWNDTTNPNGIFPRIDNGRQTVRFADRVLESATYLRLKNVQIGYKLDLPGAHSTRLYVNAVNLLTSTKYQGFDPEVSAFSGSATPNVDQGSYPNSRLFTFGVSTNF